MFSPMLQFATVALISAHTLAYPANSGPLLEAQQTGAVTKQTIGTWQYKGCYLDNGTRLLTYRFDVPEGNNAERCTALCASKGYGLAGMEYGQECWCDNYMPFDDSTVLRPDADCSFACPGDDTELCGAGNRLTLYQNTVATPPNPAQCITWRDNNWAGNLRAVNRDGTGSPVLLWNYYFNNITDNIFYNIMSGPCPDEPCRYGAQRWMLQNTNFWGGPQAAAAIKPNIGDSQAFMISRNGTPRTVNTTYCVKPNTYSPQGLFFGYPLLSVNGATDKWALCTNNTSNGRRDIVYSPIANHAHYGLEDCDQVNIEVMN